MAIQKHLKTALTSLAVAAVTGLAATAAQASTMVVTRTVDVTGIFSNGALGDPTNVTLQQGFTPGSRVLGVSWNVTLQTKKETYDLGSGPFDYYSLFNEMNVLFSDGANTPWLLLTPAFNTLTYGEGSFTGSSDLVADGNDFLLGNGILNLNFFENVDDFDGYDAIWKSGTIDLKVEVVPEPASLALSGIALAGLLAAGRRRKAHAQ